MMVPNFVLVMRPFTHAGRKNLPHSERAKRAHLVHSPIPTIKISHHTHSLGIRCPNGEARPRHSIDRPELRAQLVIDLVLLSLAEKIQI